MRRIIASFAFLMFLSRAAFAGGIEVENPVIFAMTEKMPSAGVFMIIKNNGAADRLVGVETDVAAMAEIHTTEVDDNGVMTMRPAAGFDLAEGATLALVPGGDHIMLMKLNRAMEKGSEFKLKLVFEKAGPVETTVKAITSEEMMELMPEVTEEAGAPSAHHMHHHGGM